MRVRVLPSGALSAGWGAACWAEYEGRGLLGRAAGVRSVGLSMPDGCEQAPFQLGRGLLGQAAGGLY